MKVGVLTAMIFALTVGFPIASMAGLAPDTDSDGVPDAIDNCDLVANAAPDDCDTNTDGFGNACDCDYDQSGACDVTDFNTFRTSFQNPGSNADTDANCDGATNVTDFNAFRTGFQNPGNLSSGLSCAGTIPCS